MKTGVPDPISAQLVNVWSFDLTAEASHVGEAKIIGDNDEEIWPLGW